LGWDSGFHYFIPALVPFLFFVPSKSKLIQLMLTIGLVMLYIYLISTYKEAESILSLSEISISFMNYLNITNLFIALSFLGYYYPKATRETEEKLEKSEAQYRAVVEDQTQLICRCKKDWTYTFVNLAFQRYFNMNKDEIINHDKFNMKENREDLENMKENMKRLNLSNPICVNILRVYKNDNTHWTKWINRAIFNNKDNLVEYQGVGQDITEQKKAEDNLNKTLIKLEQSNKELEQFAFIASHDLKSPLNVVTSYINIINHNYADKMNEEDLQLANHVIHRVERMREMIDNILSFSRITTEGESFKVCDMNIILKDALENLQTSIVKNYAIITYDPLPKIIGDETQLVSVFQNLIGNAIKYCEDRQPVVHITVEERENEWLFSVKDNGKGIKEEYQDKIFRLFQRGEKSKITGNGIGLAFCKKIIERHNGRIYFESKLNIGSIFYFTIEKKRELTPIKYKPVKIN